MKNTGNFLYKRLDEYGNSDYYPFHMPGHKRNGKYMSSNAPVKTDITEIEGFDNLHHAQGIIKEAQERAASVFGAEETHFLVNGSSVGLIAAIYASTKQGDRILAARNCHKSVYHAIELRGLYPVYVYPKVHQNYGIDQGIDPEDVKKALQLHKDIKAVIITSPTYEGIVSDIQKISDAAHQYGVPLIVDEAHGAHFGFHPAFPKSALSFGADIVIKSLHKTLPSLTQTALLNIQGTLADRELTRKYLTYFQTSSPSYILMASIDRCVCFLEKHAEEAFENYDALLDEFYKKAENLKHFDILDRNKLTDLSICDFDRSKIVIYSNPVTACGNEIYDVLLKQYHLQLEMASKDYVLAMTSLCDTQEGMSRLYEALSELDNQGKFISLYPKSELTFNIECADVQMNIEEAVSAQHTSVPLEFSEGRISAEYAYIYPPGVPFLVPGERIKKEHIDKIKTFCRSGFSIEGPNDPAMKKIQVISEKV
ncbi:MAG TPA: aminotransferase class I/II-fold pyridoxal phosphate-dependent enzyme [Candidatus Scybalocola faecipullorum]|nr:aminotransferase class I/II-fold pyridoxal phosphate-dependent enzyme [Candidatus Scybalocola faecipullorum]